jgi:thioredoxin reductase (NADPH)
MTRVPEDRKPLDAEDPLGRPAQTNPTLDDQQMARIAAFGTRESMPAETTLFRRGDRGRDFHVVVTGSVEVFDVDPRGEERVIVVHGPGQFVGELDLFNDHQILVNGRTGADSELIRVRRADVRRMIAAEPDLGETIIRAFILRRVGLVRHSLGGVLVIGSRHAADTQRVQRFLTRNSYPHRVLDVDTDEDARALVRSLSLAPDRLPVMIDVHDRVLENPSSAELADALGIAEDIAPDRVYDVAVVGAGPAGLAAAVYAASEGLDTIVVEASAPGGQAGTSSKIENYLGFPTGISGQALAGRAHVQAVKFGARLAVARSAVRLDCEVRPYRLQLEGDRMVTARAIVVATGARYRTLDVAGYARFEGQGIHYAATAMEAGLAAGKEVIVVGGGNSAGQAALYLARSAAHVHILIRGPRLAATMSSYLIERIAASPRITLHAHTEIAALEGDRWLRTVTWTDRETGASETRAIENLFSMIGAAPHTEWLRGRLELDDKGFVVTGRSRDGRTMPSPYETAVPGVFAVGDVRAGSVKRVASAVGEGSVVIQAIHLFLGSD